MYSYYKDHWDQKVFNDNLSEYWKSDTYRREIMINGEYIAIRFDEKKNQFRLKNYAGMSLNEDRFLHTLKSNNTTVLLDNRMKPSVVVIEEDSKYNVYAIDKDKYNDMILQAMYKNNESVKKVYAKFKEELIKQQFKNIEEYPHIKKIKSNINQQQLFELFNTKWNISISRFNQLMKTNLKWDSLDSVEKFNSKILFSESTTANRQEIALEFLNQSHEILKKVGLEYLLENTQIKFKTLSPKTLGLYYIKDDYVEIDLKSKNYQTVLRTVCHELGHRWWYKYSSSFQRNQINSKYLEVVKTGRFSIDEVKNIRKDDSIIYSGKSKKYLSHNPFLVKSNSFGKITAKSDKLVIKVPYELFLGSEWSCPQINKPKNTSEWFPTPYSMTKSDEWFCECLAELVLNKLSPIQRKWFLDLIDNK